MYLVYQPEGSDEPTRWRYNPNKLMSAEREMLERRTGRNFAEFTQDVVKGGALSRRALLFMFLKRDHPTTKWDDVDFAWDELRLEFSRGEYAEMREAIAGQLTGADLAAALEQIDAEMADAYDDEIEETGKARLPIVG
ncbi:hypothetical protein ACGFNU_24390 [Spirillospora sp. NPDC048911]|uniref:hypothetical protein n=1 Tax=Spirillospora sp. NPDC048911 TaxID=3364527 RepID=UPI00371ECDE1